MELRTFEPEDLRRVVLPDHLEWRRPQIHDSEYAEALAQAGKAWTIWCDWRPVVCFGMYEMWARRWSAWTIMDVSSRRHMITVVRTIADLIAEHPVPRLEAVVESGFVPGDRMIRMLGFQFEGLMRRYLPNGRDAAMFARVA